ncbi:TIGR01777 family oxidoreductase [Amycolatopsis mediterranei]|uniref:TIGR01777 family oxidoreductase n=1 Tax=Amycolatopsis mediterranei TaxID=33910 RepID=UPI00042744DE|nr:TIGR01777 family oxidoreductase [Amycolatopsis mediterranei]KDO06601.1 multidrug MFS transporter [Amycolatopsis mediterranei]KDU91978.1 multidrug MFS transporter [Amycolatopsis mediterranei]UZF69177.1 TIGR01777 family oxidoreductase [Amycolatopsis mediterranei]
MRVLIAGASGLIGSALGERLRREGHEVRRLVRREAREGGEFRWDPPSGTVASGAFEGVDAVVNLGGQRLFPGRWSAMRKQQLIDSRVEPTEVLAEAVAEHGIGVLVNASAVGYYGHTHESIVDESAPRGRGFLAELCETWEAATAAAGDARVVRIRTGLVLSAKGGLYGTLRPLFALCLGGRLGNGRQYMPWISLEDEAGAIVHVLTHDDVSGPVNLTGPEPVTNAEFTRAVGRALHRPAPWWVPGVALKAVLGQAGEEMALFGQRAVPAVLERSGYEFRHRNLDSALAAA